MNKDLFPIEHVHSLLADRAVQGMDAAEEAGLRCLLSQYPELDAESFDRAAAALDLALSDGQEEAMPAGLMNRLQAEASTFNAAPKAKPRLEPVAAPIPFRRPGASRNPALTWVGWLVAAVFLLVALLPSRQPGLSYSQLKQRGALVVAASKGKDGTNAMKGEFVWDSNTQQGFMKLAGLPVNDPKVSQYQLWIFDKTKPFTREMPIDGGVFDVKSNNEVLIPIKANLKVDQPFLFAVTVEPPGGVMQSKRDPLILVAPVPEANP